MYTISEVKKRCKEGRFFPYSDWFDRIFVPPSIILVWICINLKISANFVSWISALFAIAAAILISNQNPINILIGTSLYLFYYLLDYVDGAVARFNKTSGVSGQYMDWIMHVISSVAIMCGIAIGALNSSGSWLIPFCILGVAASVLTYARHSMAWFSLIMEVQQRMSKNLNLNKIELNESISSKSNIFYELIRKIISKIYHEETLLFLLPILAILNLYVSNTYIDFRVVLIIGAGTLYFTIMMVEINNLASRNKIQEAYNKLFIEKDKPNLPDDHFFK